MSLEAVRKKQNRKWEKTEFDCAEDISGQRQAGSGKFSGCDVKSKTLAVEWKETDKKSLIVKIEWLEKLDMITKLTDKIPVLGIKFNKKSGCQKYIILPYESNINMLSKEKLND